MLGLGPQAPGSTSRARRIGSAVHRRRLRRDHDQAIADEAGVAVQSVYAPFGNKRTILAELLDVSIAGDDEQIAVNDREWMRQVWEVPSTAARLGAYAAAVGSINERAGNIFAVVAAATTSTDIAELAVTTEQRRRLGATSVIDAIRKVGQLRPDLTRQQAIDVLWLLNSPWSSATWSAAPAGAPAITSAGWPTR